MNPCGISHAKDVSQVKPEMIASDSQQHSVCANVYFDADLMPTV